MPLRIASTGRRWVMVLVLGNALAVLLVLALLVLVLHSSRAAFDQRAWDAAENLAQGLQQGVAAEIARMDLALQSVALEHARRMHEPSAAAMADFARAVEDQQSLLPELDGLRVTDATGLVRYGRGASPGRPVIVSDRDYFQRARSNRYSALIVADPLQSRISGRWVVPLVRRLNGPDGSFQGIVYATVPVEHFHAQLATLKLGSQGSAALRTQGLALVTRHAADQPGLGDIGSRKVSPQLLVALERDPRSGRYLAPTAVDQVERATVYRQVGPYPLIVLVGLAPDDFLTPWRHEVALVCVLAVLTTLVLVGSSAFVYVVGRRSAGATQALRASEARLDRTGRLACVGGWEFDLATQTMQWSPQTREIHEVAADYQPTLDDSLGFFLPDARPAIAAAMQLAQERGTPWDLELPLLTAKGRSIWVRAFGEVERAGERPVRLIGALQDITEQHQRQAALQREQLVRARAERHAAELDALLQERSQMLEVLAHEVRQPLNNASAALQSAATALAEAGEQTASARVSRAQGVMGQVLASVDNTLAVASLLARAEHIARQDVDIDTLIALAIGDMPLHDRARVQVERATTTRTASADLGLMRLALRNLLANALKYSPPGAPVTVRVADSDEPLALLIDVIDSGPGVDAAFVPHLFDRGARGGQVGAGEGTLGHGLGLFIVRRVMLLHGGDVVVAGNSAEGLTMRLVILPQPEDD